MSCRMFTRKVVEICWDLRMKLTMSTWSNRDKSKRCKPFWSSKWRKQKGRRWKKRRGTRDKSWRKKGGISNILKGKIKGWEIKKRRKTKTGRTSLMKTWEIFRKKSRMINTPKTKLKGNTFNNNGEDNMRLNFKGRDRFKNISKFTDRSKFQGMRLYLIQLARHHPITHFLKDLIPMSQEILSRNKGREKPTGTKMTKNCRYLPMKFKKWKEK